MRSCERWCQSNDESARRQAASPLGDRVRRRWLRERGFELVDHVASEEPNLPSLDGFEAVAVMGAPWSVYGPEVEPWIEGLLDLLREADDRRVGVLGVCFGAQAMAAAFGAEVRKGGAEIGWHEVATTEPELIPPGPWFMWHSDVFDLPVDARLVARTDRGGPQAYALGPHLCVQFHPEADAEIVSGWVGHDATDLVEAGLSPEALIEETRRREPEARRRAAALVDRFLEGAGVPSQR